MPNYSADLEWLNITHPTEYARIPQHVLNNRDWIQQHGSFLMEEFNPPIERWVIMFYPADPESIEDGYNIELDIERPEPDDTPVHCLHHTLYVSRHLCPVCHDWEPDQPEHHSLMPIDV